MTKKPFAVVIMAAGKGTRMKNPVMAKVMYEVNGKPMLDYVMDLALRIHAAKVIVIVGWQKDSVIQHLSGVAERVRCVEQTPQLGTGHAVMQAEVELSGFDGDVLVLSGDVPLLAESTLRRLLKAHRTSGAAATVLTTELADPTGYGRILRSNDGSLKGIVEQRDATDEQRQVREINSGIYVFERAVLFTALKLITPANDQKEYYLTDVFEYFWKNGLKVGAVVAEDAREVMGINTVQQLEEARAVMAARTG